MGSTLVHLIIHIIFSTKALQPQITDINCLSAFIGGIARNKNASLIAAGGMPDHIHLLIQMPATISVADLVRDIKSNSSRWMRDTVGIKDFAWQDGYACFSVSQSNVASVIHYIKNQPEHHRAVGYTEELVAFLERHGVAYDPKYLTDDQ
jgi:putative transposase